MFSQRNNPYCELLQFCVANLLVFSYIANKNRRKMKKILGLDLGTNSIGWAVVNAETETQMVENKYQNDKSSGIT